MLLSIRLFTSTLSSRLSAFCLHRTLSSSSPVLPPRSFHLDGSVFNHSLYSNLLSFWFAGLPANATHGNAETAKRWFGVERTEAESEAFDAECRVRFSAALEEIGPERLSLPLWTSYSDERKRAHEVAAPLLAELEGAGADRLLALILLLDQIPRNIFRDPPGLRRVYGHYDRLAWSLIQSCPPSLLSHPTYAGASVYRQWLALPLMHAEDAASQEQCLESVHACKREAETKSDADAVRDAERQIQFAQRHRAVIDRFARFPHRNECLKRETSEEEREWLKTGETFGVKQGQKDATES